LPDGLFVKTKIPIRVKFGGPWDWKGWYILYVVIWNMYVYCGHMVCIRISLSFGNLVAIWYIFPGFGVLCQEKIWQPCDIWTCRSRMACYTGSLGTSTWRGGWSCAATTAAGRSPASGGRWSEGAANKLTSPEFFHHTETADMDVTRIFL
jgi:hypothetical protein